MTLKSSRRKKSWK